MAWPDGARHCFSARLCVGAPGCPADAFADSTLSLMCCSNASVLRNQRRRVSTYISRWMYTTAGARNGRATQLFSRLSQRNGYPSPSLGRETR
jgi:hypothetical protein